MSQTLERERYSKVSDHLRHKQRLGRHRNTQLDPATTTGMPLCQSETAKGPKMRKGKPNHHQKTGIETINQYSRY